MPIVSNDMPVNDVRAVLFANTLLPNVVTFDGKVTVVKRQLLKRLFGNVVTVFLKMTFEKFVSDVQFWKSAAPSVARLGPLK